MRRILIAGLILAVGVPAALRWIETSQASGEALTRPDERAHAMGRFIGQAVNL